MIQRKFKKCAISAALALVVGGVVVGCGGGSSGSSISANPTPTVSVLSSKPENVTGGSSLIDIALQSNVPANSVFSATLNGADVSSAFMPDLANAGHLIGKVTGLKVGSNTLSVSYGGQTSSIQLTNYPITGPVLSGPGLTPYICQTDVFSLPDGTKLGASTDANCSASTKVNYVYQKNTGGALVAMPSTTTLPADVATTTTSTGTQVPFVVRVETGTMDRGIYQNAVLHDPTKDAAPTPLAPPKGWNKRLIGNHGSGCAGGWYIQGASEGVNPLTGDNLLRLGEGYAIFINSLNHPTNSCNAHLAGEATMMGKENFIKTFGKPTYTVSTGCSGGAYTSLQVADAFPDLFDGISISCTFPDAMSISMSSLDSKLLSRFVNTTNPSVIPESQMVTVSGHKNARAWYDLALQSGRTDPVPNRTDSIPASPLLGGYKSAVWNAAVPTNLRYDPVTNPTGARPTVFDVAKNILGINKTTGFANRTFDNIGVQYGLNALNSGTITPAQFIALNESIGGYDSDGNYTTTRTAADADTIKRAYQSGLQLSGGGGLASIPVFDFTGIYDEDQYYHYQWFHFAARERLAKANGNAANYVMWRGGPAITELFGQTTPIGTAVTQAANTQSWAAFIKWMEAYKADTSSITQREKVIKNKPANAVDGCFTKSTTPVFIAETQTLSSQANSQCNTLWPSWTAPRIESGGPVAADILKCQLKPVNYADYKVTFSAAEKAKLEAAFSTGVCDWSKPGVNQTPVVAYPSFGPSPANLIFDITKM
jgi:Tannase-like family of unknown function (DUF6351)